MTQMKRYTGYVNIVSRKITLYNYYTHKLIIMPKRGYASMYYSQGIGQGKWKRRTGQRLERVAARRGMLGRFGKYLPYARYAGAGVVAYKGVRWAMRKAARHRRFNTKRVIPRSPRETKTEIQEVHRFYNQITQAWYNHITHPFGSFTSAPQLITNAPASTDAYNVSFDITEHLFTNTSGFMNNEDCSIDIRGIKFIIELENPSLNDEIYVRTLLLMNKNAAGIRTGNTTDLQDELFQDHHDKCKRLDFDANLPTAGAGAYTENAKMKMKINRIRKSVYHDRVLKIGHNMDVKNTDGDIVTNIAPRRGFMNNNQRRLIINWFPKGGFRFKVAMDGANRKNHMEQCLQFMMFAEKKQFLNESKTFTPTELNYKLKTQIWYKKVY